MVATSVVMAADERYLPGLLACTQGVAQHSGGSSIIIIDCGLSTESKRLVERTLSASASSVSFRQVNRRRGLLDDTGLAPASYARLFLDDLGVSDPRILYLDVDCIVVGRLGELFDLELDGYPVAAAREAYTPTVASKDGLADWRELGLDRATKFFNSGVLLVATDAWRQEQLTDRAIAKLSGYARDGTGNDQHALNAVLAGRWLELDPVWNVTRYWFKPERRLGDLSDIIDRARVLHYVGPNKPWLHGVDLPASVTKRYFDALDETPLSGWRPQPTRSGPETADVAAATKS